MPDSDRNGNNFPVRSYDLPDSIFLEASGESSQCLVWQPRTTMVVIGKGSDPALEVNYFAAMRDEVPVIRRATGGSAVVLMPEMLVASFVIRQAQQLASREYFRLLNSLIVTCLAGQGVTGLEQRGISDIALADRKIAGTAIYRNRHLVFFHAILNLAGGTEEMEEYLKAPPRMPDYRRSRSHSDFVTSLAAEGYDVDVPRFTRDLKTSFNQAVHDQLFSASGMNR